MKTLAVIVLVLAGVAALVLGEPSMERRLDAARAEHDAAMSTRTYHIDAGELLGLMHNNQVRIAVLDVRDEADFNLFHLIDARHLTFSGEDFQWIGALPAQSVIVLVSNGEARAEAAWRHLSVEGVPNVYVLDGGINGWLTLCRPKDDHIRPAHIRRPDAAQLGEDQLHYAFPAALGDGFLEAKPPADCFADREFEVKVKVVTPVAAPDGGCGG